MQIPPPPAPPLCVAAVFYTVLISQYKCGRFVKKTFKKEFCLIDLNQIQKNEKVSVFNRQLSLRV